MKNIKRLLALMLTFLSFCFVFAPVSHASKPYVMKTAAELINEESTEDPAAPETSEDESSAEESFSIIEAANSGYKAKPALEILDPDALTEEEALELEKEKRLEKLIYDAYYTYEYTKIPLLRDMLNEPVEMYVHAKQSYYSGPEGKNLGVFGRNQSATVYAHRAEWVFLRAEDGMVGWVYKARLPWNVALDQ